MAGTKTDDWIVFADTHVPYEVIDMSGKKSGGELNFPPGVMGEGTAANLAKLGYTRVSQLIAKARSQDVDEFKAEFKSVWPSRFDGVYRYLRRLSDNGVSKGRH